MGKLSIIVGDQIRYVIHMRACPILGMLPLMRVHMPKTIS